MTLKTARVSQQKRHRHIFSRVSDRILSFFGTFYFYSFFHWSWMSTPLFSKCETKARQKNCQQARDMGVGLELFCLQELIWRCCQGFLVLFICRPIKPRLPAMTKQLRHLVITRVQQNLKVVLWRHRCFFFQRIVLPFSHTELVIIWLQSLRCWRSDANQAAFYFFACSLCINSTFILVPGVCRSYSGEDRGRSCY